jgi:hypothetical protein
MPTIQEFRDSSFVLWEVSAGNIQRCKTAESLFNAVHEAILTEMGSHVKLAEVDGGIQLGPAATVAFAKVKKYLSGEK